jgi:hypothetical protein
MTLRNRGEPAGFSRLAGPFTAMAMRRANRNDLAALSVQARDGATRADLEAVITCAMAAWDTLASADR